MRRTALTLAIGCTLTLATVTAQSSAPNVLATVRIPAGAAARGTPLPPGSYDLRLTLERPTPLAGQSPDAQRWVEFVAEGKVIAREIAEVLQDDDLPAIGASSTPVRSGVHVDMLTGGEFLRISVKRDGQRYLIYLPMTP